MPGLQLGVGSRDGMSGRVNEPFSINHHCLLVRGEAGSEGGSPTQALRATSSLPGLCLIQAKLSEMEEVKPAR